MTDSNRYEGFETAQDRERRAAQNRQRIADIQAEERRRNYEASKRRDEVRTVENALGVRERRRGGGAPAVDAPFASPTGEDGDPGAPDLDAAASISHSSILASPTRNTSDAAEQERYEQEMVAYEERRRQARYNGVLFLEPAPAPPGKKGTRQGRPPWA